MRAAAAALCAAAARPAVGGGGRCDPAAVPPTRAQCETNPDCIWDTAQGRCIAQCDPILVQTECVQEQNCKWDMGMCVPQGGTGGGGGPGDRCNPIPEAECETQQGCKWDVNANMCSPTGGGGGPGGRCDTVMAGSLAEEKCNMNMKCKWDVNTYVCSPEGGTGGGGGPCDVGDPYRDPIDNKQECEMAPDCMWDEPQYMCIAMPCDMFSSIEAVCNKCTAPGAMKPWCFPEGSTGGGGAGLCDDSLPEVECVAIPGCTFDSTLGYCFPTGGTGGGGGPGDRCDPVATEDKCSTQQGCKWDRNTNMCLPEDGTDGRCDLIVAQPECDSWAHCMWDAMTDMCIRDLDCTLPKAECETQQGCEWNGYTHMCLPEGSTGGGGGGLGGRCDPVTTKDECEKEQGCKWDVVCMPEDSGPGDRCDPGATQSVCEKQSGCKWDVNMNMCSPEGGAGGGGPGGQCGRINEELECNTQQGCKWALDTLMCLPSRCEQIMLQSDCVFAEQGCKWDQSLDPMCVPEVGTGGGLCSPMACSVKLACCCLGQETCKANPTCTWLDGLSCKPIQTPRPKCDHPTEDVCNGDDRCAWSVAEDACKTIAGGLCNPLDQEDCKANPICSWLDDKCQLVQTPRPKCDHPTEDACNGDDRCAWSVAEDGCKPIAGGLCNPLDQENCQANPICTWLDDKCQLIQTPRPKCDHPTEDVCNGDDRCAWSVVEDECKPIAGGTGGRPITMPNPVDVLGKWAVCKARRTVDTCADPDEADGACTWCFKGEGGPSRGGATGAEGWCQPKSKFGNVLCVPPKVRRVLIGSLKGIQQFTESAKDKLLGDIRDKCKELVEQHASTQGDASAIACASGTALKMLSKETRGIMGEKSVMLETQVDCNADDTTDKVQRVLQDADFKGILGQLVEAAADLKGATLQGANKEWGKKMEQSEAQARKRKLYASTLDADQKKKLDPFAKGVRDLADGARAKGDEVGDAAKRWLAPLTAALGAERPEDLVGRLREALGEMGDAAAEMGEKMQGPCKEIRNTFAKKQVDAVRAFRGSDSADFALTVTDVEQAISADNQAVVEQACEKLSTLKEMKQLKNAGSIRELSVDDASKALESAAQLTAGALKRGEAMSEDEGMALKDIEQKAKARLATWNDDGVLRSCDASLFDSVQPDDDGNLPTADASICGADDAVSACTLAMWAIKGCPVRVREMCDTDAGGSCGARNRGKGIAESLQTCDAVADSTSGTCQEGCKAAMDATTDVGCCMYNAWSPVISTGVLPDGDLSQLAQTCSGKDFPEPCKPVPNPDEAPCKLSFVIGATTQTDMDDAVKAGIGKNMLEMAATKVDNIERKSGPLGTLRYDGTVMEKKAGKCKKTKALQRALDDDTLQLPALLKLGAQTMDSRPLKISRDSRSFASGLPKPGREVPGVTQDVSGMFDFMADTVDMGALSSWATLTEDEQEKTCERVRGKKDDLKKKLGDSVKAGMDRVNVDTWASVLRMGNEFTMDEDRGHRAQPLQRPQKFTFSQTQALIDGVSKEISSADSPKLEGENWDKLKKMKSSMRGEKKDVNKVLDRSVDSRMPAARPLEALCLSTEGGVDCGDGSEMASAALDLVKEMENMGEPKEFFNKDCCAGDVKAQRYMRKMTAAVQSENMSAALCNFAGGRKGWKEGSDEQCGNVCKAAIGRLKQADPACLPHRAAVAETAEQDQPYTLNLPDDCKERVGTFVDELDGCLPDFKGAMLRDTMGKAKKHATKAVDKLLNDWTGRPKKGTDRIKRRGKDGKEKKKRPLKFTFGKMKKKDYDGMDDDKKLKMCDALKRDVCEHLAMPEVALFKLEAPCVATEVSADEAGLGVDGTGVAGEDGGEGRRAATQQQDNGMLALTIEDSYVDSEDLGNNGDNDWGSSTSELGENGRPWTTLPANIDGTTGGGASTTGGRSPAGAAGESEGGDDGGSNMGAIIGIIAGVVGALGIGGFITMTVMKKKQQQQQQNGPNFSELDEDEAKAAFSTPAAEELKVNKI